jgi:hypothetical protein
MPNTGSPQADREVEADQKRAGLGGATQQPVEKARRAADEFRRLNMPLSAAFDGHSHPALLLLHAPITVGDQGASDFAHTHD